MSVAREDSRPGRTCPVSYRYSPRVFRREPQVIAEALYVVGGLYGNLEALDVVQGLAARERGPVTVVFNGDFHWFDIEPEDFESLSLQVLDCHALRGNVETELAHDDDGAGCGCAYPADVSDAEVTRSNEILARLRETARRFPDLRLRLGALPMHLGARVGDARIGIVHGDACSLAGWGFAAERLRDARHARWLESIFEESGVDVFASSHTCHPGLEPLPWGVIANNGAAGMPNHPGTHFGLMTRIATRAFDGPELHAGVVAAGVHVEALRLDYDHAAWMRRFLASWPPGSPAHASYFRRIAEGPRGGVPTVVPEGQAA